MELTRNFQDAPNEYARKINEKVDLYAFGDGNEFMKLLDRVANGECVTSCNEAFVFSSMIKHPKLSVSNTYFFKEKPFKPFILVLPFEKHSIYTYPINYYWRRLLESGIYTKLYNDAVLRMKTTSIPPTYDRGNIAIQMADMQTAFYALIVGYISSFICFLFELRRKKKKKELSFKA
ncbi:hypothetical protein Avbf_14999 [Armadillidium vulgare]|nr:hypothetical protein Avbf_14999 [Armadillidium vulgare]